MYTPMVISGADKMVENIVKPEYTVLPGFKEVDEEVMDYFRTHDLDFCPPISTRPSIEGYIRSVFDTDGRLIICRVSGKIVAAMGIGLNHPTWKYYYHYVSVDAPYRRLGLANSMLQIAIGIFKEHGARRIVVGTWSTNQASNPNFKKNGFVHIETITNERGGGVHSRNYTKVLHPLGFNRPVTSLGIAGLSGTFSTGNFIRTVAGIPLFQSKEYDQLPFMVINDPPVTAADNQGSDETENRVLSRVMDVSGIFCRNKISHLVVLSYSLPRPLSGLFAGSTMEVIHLVDVCLKLISGLPFTWLLIADRDTYAKGVFSHYGIHDPEEAQIERISRIIVEVQSGASASFYSNEMAEFAKSRDCNGLILACTDLHGMFGFYQQYQEVAIMDPLLELMLHLEAARKC